ncbi:MAG: intradiol ring-cleavage dioxygenase [Candidatus Eiseniibacteriota bacterium]
MRNLTEANLTDAVIAKFANSTDPRFKEIMTSLVRHLHAFVREVELTEAEWFEGIKFLTETGQKCDDQRQEFILLSDTTGISMLVDAINHRMPSGATESTVLGPFYRAGAPDIEMGGTIAQTEDGDPAYISGRVTSPDGKPIAGALLDIWQTAPNGLYETQDEDQPDYNLRGQLHTDKDGRYAFRTVIPVSYPVPTDGPVGRMLKAMGRHPMRPAHVHFVITAPGYERLATHLFAEGDKYLDSDAVFAVKNSLVVKFEKNDSAEMAKKLGFKQAPFYTTHYDFGLKPAA